MEDPPLQRVWRRGWKHTIGGLPVEPRTRYQGDTLVYSQSGDDLLPVTLNASASGSFSAVWIEPLSASYLTSAHPKSPFPKEEPQYPQLQKFQPTAPDYKAYCDPQVGKAAWDHLTKGLILSVRWSQEFWKPPGLTRSKCLSSFHWWVQSLLPHLQRQDRRAGPRAHPCVAQGHLRAQLLAVQRAK